MRLMALLLLTLLFAGCASAQSLSGKINSDLFLSDFSAAQANYTSAAAAQPAGSALAIQFTASAACMAAIVTKFTPASATVAETNKGLVSLASIIDIQYSISKAQEGVTGNVNCDTLVGHIINNLNSAVVKAATSGIALP